MAIRLLMGYTVSEGADLADILLKRGTAEFCLNASSYDEEAALDTPDNIHIPRRYGKSARYGEICDVNELPALSEDDLNVMQKYLPMYMNICVRIAGFPMTWYEDEKSRFYVHFRFWKHIFEEYKFNLVLFRDPPHYRPYHYVIYALAKEYGVPVLIFGSSNIRRTYVWGDSIEGMGKAIGDYYLNVAKDMEIADCVLEGEVKYFYDKYQQHDIADIMSESFRQKRKNELAKFHFRRFVDKHPLLTPYKIFFRKVFRVKKKGVTGIKRERRKGAFGGLRGAIRTNKRYADYMKFNAVTQDEYNKMAELPDYSKKYIYFGLQMTPELTTIPMAGVFSDQITSVQLLARAAEKCGVMLYVKEHYVQMVRSNWDYSAIENIPNVVLIKTTVSSDELVSNPNCIAAATQTGSIILESAFRGKPCLVTSSGATWKEFPSMIRIRNEDQGAEVIQSLLRNGYKIDQNDILRYFYAIQKNTIFATMVDGTNDPKFVAPDDYRRELEELVALIERLHGDNSESGRLMRDESEGKDQ